MGFGDIFRRRKTQPTYEDIKKDCLKRGKKWEDPDFLADENSLFQKQKSPVVFEWKRPSEICDDPQLFVGGGSRFDVMQGMLGDCWLLAAVASLSVHEGLLHQVISDDQNFDSGCIRFRFWQYGEWKDILVDDRLPTYKNKLVFMHSEQTNEFWSALLEKAYAKLCGCYENLKGGQTSEAMEDFTGGVTEVIPLSDAKSPVPPNLFKIMIKANDRSSLMGCSITAKPNEIEAKGPMGLVMGHAYSVTNVVTGKLYNGETVELVRVRNPWGNEREWEGAWGDDSQEWKLMKAEEKQRLGIIYEDDGEFWMCYEDFLKYFTKLEICALGPDSPGTDNPKGKKISWEAIAESHSWKKNSTAGGCRNFPDTFHLNPQMRLSVVDPDEDDEDSLSTIIVGLMQKDRRKLKSEGGQRTIGFAIYEVPEDAPQTGLLEKDFFLYHKSYLRSKSFINSRGICERFRVPAGNYVIVPSTFKAGEEADFLLRVFSEKAHEAGVSDEECGMREIAPKEKTPEEDDKNEKLREFFLQVAGDDENMDAEELRNLVNKAFQNQFKFDGFSLETCRSMVALLDEDESGKLGCEEFMELWELLSLWRAAFAKCDQDKSGKLHAIELRYALKSIGLTLSTQALEATILRFASRDGEIEFDDYILLCCRLRTCFETMNVMRKPGTKEMIFDPNLFIKTCIYL